MVSSSLMFGAVCFLLGLVLGCIGATRTRLIPSALTKALDTPSSVTEYIELVKEVCQRPVAISFGDVTNTRTARCCLHLGA